ncbi:hypothetical protein [Pseudomonas akapageensis]|uniref:hypothetical protein n=1 Tax=Pseudomonas akapageensis TaxID=2609961 RepID=UPI00140DE690|nr:hypothetical protein [Pseudomonas akapageensis]
MKKLVFLSCLLSLNATSALADAPQISSDLDDATFSIVSMTGDSADRTVVTKRVGVIGTSYAKRVLNCADRTVRFLGSANIVEDLASAKQDRESTPIYKGSLSETIAEVACEASDNDAPVLASQGS